MSCYPHNNYNLRGVKVSCILNAKKSRCTKGEPNDKANCDVSTKNRCILSKKQKKINKEKTKEELKDKEIK